MTYNGEQAALEVVSTAMSSFIGLFSSETTCCLRDGLINVAEG